MFYLIDDEMMSTEATPPSSSELTELGKCLMKQEVRKLSFTSALRVGVFIFKRRTSFSRGGKPKANQCWEVQ